MAGEQYNMGQGGAGLVAPFVPIGQPLVDPKFALSVVQQRMLNAYRAQQYQVDIAKLAQEQKLKEEEFQMHRDLAQGQIDALAGSRDAEANYHNAMADYYRTTKTQEAKDKAAVAQAGGDYVDAMSQIPQEQWGTDEGANQMSVIDNKFSDTGLFDTGGGRALQQRYMVKQRMAASRNAADLVNTDRRLKSSIKASPFGNLPDATADLLNNSYDPETDTFKKTDTWSVANGAPYMTLDTEGNVIPPDEVSKWSSADQKNKGWTSRGLTAGQARSWAKMNQRVLAGSTGGRGAPPLEDIQNAVQPQQPQKQRFRYDPQQGLVPITP